MANMHACTTPKVLNLKVLHVIGSVGVGGAEKHVLDLCIQQKALGLDVHVALPAAGALGIALAKPPHCLYVNTRRRTLASLGSMVIATRNT